jgi:hypothetical protein
MTTWQMRAASLERYSMPSDQNRGDNWMRGHGCAVLAASATFATSMVFFSYAFLSIRPSSHIYEIAVSWGAFFVIFALCSFFLAMLPVFIVHRIAQRFSITNVGYYVAFGTLTGLIICPIFVYFRPRGALEPWPDPPFYVEVMNIGGYFAFFGAIGGLAFWWAVGRFIQTTVSPAADT